MSKFAKVVIITLVSLMGLGLLSVAGFIYYTYALSKELPTVEEMSKFQYNEPMVVYDAAGTIIAELGPERRYPVSIDRMPKYMGQAVVAVEDARFYEHSGVDLLGISRAFFVNLKAGRVVEGGSTLTQQLVKILYLTPEKKLKRKLKEAILAYKIDQYLTKDNILELYLNQVNFGRGGYGVQAASINYFGKNVEDLTLAEAAMIAGIPKAPSLYGPHINMERAIGRRNHVLYRMMEVGYITEAQYTEAIAEPVLITESIPLKLKYAGYFMDYVHKYLSEELQLKDSQNMGLKIYTTLKLDYQLEAERAVKESLRSISKREGYYGSVGKFNREQLTPSAIDIDNETDMIGLRSSKDLFVTPSYLLSMGIRKALVTAVDIGEAAIELDGLFGRLTLEGNEWAKRIGDTGDKLLDFRTILAVDDIVYVSVDEKDPELYYLEQDPQIEGAIVSVNPKTGEIYAMVGGFSYDKSFFNRAAQAKRQTGSAFKPIVYSTAFENGFLPMDTVLDVPVIAEPDENEKSWRPKNYEDKFYGKTTLKEALVKSRNVVTVKVAEKVGIKKIIAHARALGLNSDMPNDLSVSLGSASASPLELAYAYSAFANEGKRPAAPYFITKIEDISGNVLYEFAPPEPVEAIDPTVAEIMTDILIDAVEKGSGWRAKAIQRPVAGKTGTTNDSKDAWFVGFLPSLVTVSWVGYDDFRKMGDYATGSSAAVPQWLDYTKGILKYLPFELFPLSGKVAYFKVDTDTNQITDSITGNYTFEVYPINDEGMPVKIQK